MSSSLTRWLAEVRMAAHNIEHEWDRRAIEWPDLGKESVVFEVGAFKGRWALQMAERYNPRLFCFEPQEWAALVAKVALTGYNARVFTYGLGERDGRLPMRDYETDSCAFYQGDGEAMGEMRDIAGVVAELGIAGIDLMLVNIEGYEYTLIPHMLTCQIYPRALMVQTHGSARADEVLRSLLAQDYDLLWDYGATLSAWGLS